MDECAWALPALPREHRRSGLQGEKSRQLLLSELLNDVGCYENIGLALVSLYQLQLQM